MNLDIEEQRIFEGVLLLSDIDGTLYNRKLQVPRRSLDAIERFTRLGGLFALSSGRNPNSMRPAANEAQVNCPCITLNGAMLYDFQKDCAVMSNTLPDNYIQLILRLHAEFPELGAQTYVGTHIYNVYSNEVVENLFVMENQRQSPPVSPVLAGGAVFPSQPVNKVLLGGSPELLAKVSRAVESSYGDVMEGMKALRTAVMYYEILPRSADKGTGAIALSELCGISRSRIAAVGDYYNDVEMLNASALPMAAANAPEDVRALAHYVTCDCDDGVVADAIGHIESLINQGKW